MQGSTRPVVEAPETAETESAVSPTIETARGIAVNSNRDTPLEFTQTIWFKTIINEYTTNTDGLNTDQKWPARTELYTKARNCPPPKEIVLAHLQHGVEKHFGGKAKGTIWNPPLKKGTTSTEKLQIMNKALEKSILTHYLDELREAYLAALEKGEKTTINASGYIEELGIPGYAEEGVYNSFYLQIDINPKSRDTEGNIIIEYHGYPKKAPEIGVLSVIRTPDNHPAPEPS